MPWEVIVKTFRVECGNENHKHLFDWSARFLSFLTTRFPTRPEMEVNHFSQLIAQQYTDIAGRFANAVIQMIGPTVPGEGRSQTRRSRP